MRRNYTRRPLAESLGTNPFELRKAESPAEPDPDSEVHVFGKGVICDTEKRGYATPEGRSVLEIVLDATEGFIPLWAKDMTLRWRFQERSMRAFREPEPAKRAI